jgi:hypothetical protein
LAKGSRFGAYSHATGKETFDVAYMVLSGTTRTSRGPALLRDLIDLGFPTIPRSDGG